MSLRICSSIGHSSLDVFHQDYNRHIYITIVSITLFAIKKVIANHQPIEGILQTRD